MKNLRKITGIFMVVALAVIIAWDAFVAAEPTKGDTISEIIRDYASGHPVIPVGIGVVAGHFFWPKKKRINGIWTAIWLSLVGFGLLFSGLVFDLRWPPMLPFIGGVCLGHMVWAQVGPRKE